MICPAPPPALPRPHCQPSCCQSRHSRIWARWCRRRAIDRTKYRRPAAVADGPSANRQQSEARRPRQRWTSPAGADGCGQGGRRRYAADHCHAAAAVEAFGSTFFQSIQQVSQNLLPSPAIGLHFTAVWPAPVVRVGFLCQLAAIYKHEGEAAPARLSSAAGTAKSPLKPLQFSPGRFLKSRALHCTLAVTGNKQIPFQFQDLEEHCSFESGLISSY